MSSESAISQPVQVAAFFQKQRTGLVTLVFAKPSDPVRFAVQSQARLKYRPEGSK